MADCTDFPTPEDAKRFKNNADSTNEYVTSGEDTFIDQDGNEHLTMTGIRNSYDPPSLGSTQGASLVGTRNNTNVQVELNALQSGQSSGTVGFATQSDLYANLDYPDKSVAHVTNDQTPTNNGTYRKSGVSGAGSWVQSSSDLASQAYQQSLTAQATADAPNNELVRATNQVTNGDFGTGDTAPWNLQRWASTGVVNGRFEGVSTGVGDYSYIRQYVTVNQGDKVYFSAKFQSPRDLFVRASIGSSNLSDYPLVAGVETLVDDILTSGATTNGYMIYGFFGTVASDTYTIDSAMCLNLTAIFGAGNEPDLLDVRALLNGYADNYFDGENILVSTRSIMPLGTVNKTSRLNITLSVPLSSGYYTELTARAAVPTSRRALGLKLTFQSASGVWDETQFVGDSIDDWSIGTNWISTQQKNELSPPSETYGIKGTKTGVELYDAVHDTFGQDNYYIECVFVPDPTTPDITYIMGGDGTGGPWLRRRLTGTYEFRVYDETADYSLSFVAPEGKPVYLCLFKIGQEFSLYANGDLVSTVTMVGQHKRRTDYPLFTPDSTSLFRVGSTDTPNPVERYNNGRPLDYVATDAVLDFKTDGFTTTAFRDNATKRYYDYTGGDGVSIPDMYPLEITGEGVPTVVPQFARQKYHDKLSSVDYIARGKTLLTDWHLVSTSAETDTKQATLVSGQNIKTINNASVLGSGNLTVGDGEVSIESKAFEFVVDYGAVGDGITDDTQAVEDATTASAVSGNPVLFTKGEYLIKRGLIAKSGVNFVGTGGASLKRPVPVTQAITENMSINQTFVKVGDASAYEVGQEIYILEPVYGSLGVTYGVINDITGNTITFTPTDGLAGSAGAYQVGTVVVTTAFAMIRSNPSINTINNTVRGLTFNPQAQPTDPLYYFCAIVHFNAASSDTTVKKCIINGSNSDGISLQGRNRLDYLDNELNDIAHNATHFGTTATEINITGNEINRAGRNGVFHCFNNDRININNNHFTDCRWGIAELDNQDNLGDRTSIISCNTFENCELGVNGGGHDVQVVNNIFTKMELGAVGIQLAGQKGGMNVSGNIFSDFNANYSGNCIEITGGKSHNANGNIIKDFVGTGAPMLISGAETSIATGNNIESSGLKGIEVTNTLNCTVAVNTVKVATGGTAINKTGTNTGLIEGLNNEIVG